MTSPDAGLGGHSVERALGRGGSATVYLTDATPPVALKVLHRDRRRPVDLERLRREFEIPRRVEHPHVIAVQEHGDYWLSMEYVDGGSAGRLLATVDRITTLGQIAEALDHVHRLGVVHCDVKPANILAFGDFRARGAVLIDFGVAHVLAEDARARLARDPSALSLDPARRITRAEPGRPAQVQASLPYAAPELLLGRSPTPAVDEYALACTAVEMLTGSPPFKAATAFSLMDCHLHAAPPAISRRISWIPRAVDSILAKAMAKDPEARYPSCGEFVRLLSRALGSPD